jgi:hypothetical protein
MPRHRATSRRQLDALIRLGVEAMEPRQVCAVAIGLADDTGRSRTDRVTSNPMIAVNRTVTASQRVEYRVNGGPAQTATITNGRTFLPEGLEVDGHYRIVARIVDAAGRSTSPTRPLAIKVDRTAAPLNLSLRQDTGVSSNDGITTMAGLSASGQEPRAVVQFSRDSGSFDPLTAVWGSYRPQAGENRWWVRQVDPAGNGSTPVSVSFMLDTATDRVSRLEGPQSATYEAVEGAVVSWTLQFDQPMHVAPVNGTLPAVRFTFGGRELFARYQEGSGTNRLTYAYTFTAADAGTGELTAPVKSCLCYGGTITDAAGNRHRKHALPPVAV